MESRTTWLALACALAGACDKPAATREGRQATSVRRIDSTQPLPNIVLVSIDSLRYDHLGCYGYSKPTSPTIDALAANGVRCELAVSTTSWTLPAHAALFTGQYDSTHGVVDNGLRLAESRTTLAEVLHAAGYHTAGFFGGPYLHPIYGLSQGFDTWESCMSASASSTPERVVDQILSTHDAGSHADVTGPRTVAAVERWLDARAKEPADSRPFFLFLHLWDVHHDYIPPSEYAQRFDPDYTGSLDVRDLTRNDAISGLMSARDLEHLIALYDAEIRFTDDNLKAILAAVAQRASAQDTLIAIVSDHGEEFFEHGGKGHQRTLYREVVRVPMVFSWPGHLGPALRVAPLVRLIDVMPTLLGLAGLDAPRQGEGRDVSAALRGAELAPAPALMQLSVDGRDVRALAQGLAQVVREGGNSAYNGLHRLDAEVEERAGARSLAEELRALERELDASRKWLERLGPGAQPIRVDAELSRRLKDLGYSQGASDEAPR